MLDLPLTNVLLGGACRLAESGMSFIALDSISTIRGLSMSSVASFQASDYFILVGKQFLRDVLPFS